MTIPEQLTDIYYKEEDWHTYKMSYNEALMYHKTRYDNKTIHTYEEDNEVLGYYERYIKNDTAILFNVWIKKDRRRGEVFRELYNHFMATLPENVKYIVGEKQKLGGKFQSIKIRRR